jgi:hypothetical protein
MRPHMLVIGLPSLGSIFTPLRRLDDRGPVPRWRRFP